MSHNLAFDPLIAEFGTWDALADLIRTEDVDEKLKDAVLAAVPRLALHLGKNWPSSAIRTRHILTSLFFNHAEWTRDYLCEFAGAMDAVAGLARWKGLRSRIRRSDQAVGAIFELNLATRALRQGLCVILEPATPGHRTDLAVSFNQPRRLTLYKEAKHIRALPNRAYDAEKITDRVFPVSLYARNLCGGGRFLRMPGPEEVAGLIEKVDHFWTEINQTRRGSALWIEGLLEVWGADRDDREAQDFFVSQGYPKVDVFSGPSVSFDALARVCNAVQQKSVQLPQGHSCMIVLEAPSELELFQIPDEVVCREVGNTLHAIPHISAVALLRRTLNGPAPNGEIRRIGHSHVSVKTPRHLIHFEEVLLVRNEARINKAVDKLIDITFGICP